MTKKDFRSLISTPYKNPPLRYGTLHYGRRRALRLEQRTPQALSQVN